MKAPSFPRVSRFLLACCAAAIASGCGGGSDGGGDAAGALRDPSRQLRYLTPDTFVNGRSFETPSSTIRITGELAYSGGFIDCPGSGSVTPFDVEWRNAATGQTGSAPVSVGCVTNYLFGAAVSGVASRWQTDTIGLVDGPNVITLNVVEDGRVVSTDAVTIIRAEPYVTFLTYWRSAPRVWTGTLSEHGADVSATAVLGDDAFRIFSAELGLVIICDFGSIYSERDLDGTGQAYVAGPAPEIEYAAFGEAIVQSTQTSRTTIEGSYVLADGRSGTFSFTDAPGNGDGAALTLAEGVWSETTASAVTTSLAIDVTGTLVGSDTTGCTYLGQVEIVYPIVNVYRADIDSSACGDARSFEGYAFLTDTDEIPAGQMTYLRFDGQGAFVHELYR